MSNGAQLRFGASSRGAAPAAELAFGAWGVGGRGWGGARSEAERVAAVERAYELGIRFFDTAPAYGDSERILGTALKPVRDEVAIATKVGPRDDPRASLEASLQRLATERVDLLQLHEPKDDMESKLEVMHELREEGKAAALGICNATTAQLTRACETGSITALQAAYNLFDRDVEERDLPACRRLGLGFLAYRPLSSGLLGGRFSSVPPRFAPDDHRGRIYWFKGEEFRRRMKVVEELRRLADRSGRSLAGVALGWVRSRPGVTHVLMGARSADQVEANARHSTPPDGDEIAAIDALVADVFRPPRATASLLDASTEWGERERFIVERLDGRRSYEEIAAEWSDKGGKPMIAAQVKTFGDELVRRGVAEQ